MTVRQMRQGLLLSLQSTRYPLQSEDWLLCTSFAVVPRMQLHSVSSHSGFAEVNFIDNQSCLDRLSIKKEKS